MPDYQQSKIYKIISPHTDKIYIGSTTKPYLACRKATHKSHYKMWKADNTKQYCASFVLYDLGDVEFILLELYKCNSKDELTARERYWIEQNINNVINIMTRPNVSKEELKQSKKEYDIKNKDKIKEYIKDYRIKNKEAIAIYKKEYYIKNKEAVEIYKKEYYIKNKDKIKEYQKQRKEIKMLI